MDAFRYTVASESLELQIMPIPEPNEGHVLIKVRAAGLCHSDVHVLKGGRSARMCALPITLGHEIAGVIAKLGSSPWNASPLPLKEGDCVAVACIEHLIEIRNFQEPAGLGCDGGYAGYVVLPTKNLVSLPKGVNFTQAAVATDSVATVYHAVVSEGNVSKFSTVVIIGLGGLGLNGVAIAASIGATVYGIDINESTFDQAHLFGAVSCASSLSHYSDKTFDVVLDFAGAQATVAAVISAVKPGGTVVRVGLSSESITLTTTSIVTKNIVSRGSAGASLHDFCIVSDMIASDELRPQIQEIPFQSIPEVLQKLSTSEVSGRLCAVISSLRKFL